MRVLALARGADPPPLSCRVILEEEGVIQEEAVDLFGSSALPLTTGDLWLAEVDIPSLPGLPAGVYRWVLRCADGGMYVSPDRLVVDGQAGARLLRRQLDLRYGGLIRLRGYRWWVEGADLHLELEWEALAGPGADYKVFVHLLDSTGKLVRQYDAMPCDWGCPTAGWQAGQVVQDEAVLPLWGLPPGEYRLAVGLYNAVTLERVATAEGETYSLLPSTLHIAPLRP